MRKPKRVPRKNLFEIEGGEEIRVDQLEPGDLVLMEEQAANSGRTIFYIARFIKAMSKNSMRVFCWEWLCIGAEEEFGAPKYFTESDLERMKILRLGRWKKEKRTSGT